MSRSIVFYSVMIVLVLLVVEALAFSARSVAPDLFDHRRGTLLGIDADDHTPSTTADAELGWEPAAPEHVSEVNCLGATITYTIADDHSRAYPGYLPRTARVVLAGDSYTYGSGRGWGHLPGSIGPHPRRACCQSGGRGL
jgi:hypothetical protein